ncbi:hypothetical protein [Vibrio proteolyticus]
MTFSQNVSPRTRSATGATLSDHVFGFLPNGQVRQQLKTDSLQKLTPGLVAIPNQSELEDAGAQPTEPASVVSALILDSPPLKHQSHAQRM